MTAKLGTPDFCPKTAVDAGYLAETEGWTVVPSYVTVPERNVTLRFRRDGYPPMWAAWRNGGFWRAYAQTAQRMSFRDLLAVLRDPDLLIPEDVEWPFGPPENTDYYRSDRIACGEAGHIPKQGDRGQMKCSRCDEKLSN